MRKIFFAALMVLFFISGYSQVWMSSNAGITFFSESPLENIEATTYKGMTALNTQTGIIYFKVAISSFEFKSSLMKEHFNENYMESSEYPVATFSGKIIEIVDFTKPGVVQVRAKGLLNIHGVKVERIIKSTITIGDNELSIKSNFLVNLQDHNIKIPRIVYQKIAPEIAVDITATLAPAQI